MRLKDRVAIVVGAGQSPGEGIGNGRATALTFAREGAKVLCVDHNLASAQETVEMIARQAGHGGRVQGRRHQECRHQGDGGRCAQPLGHDRHPAQQCRRQPVRRRCRTARHHRGGVRSLRGDQSEELHPRRQARDPDHAPTEERRHHQHLLDGGDHDLSLRRLQGDQVGDDLLHRAARLSERAIRHPRQRDPARADEHADGRRYPRPRIQEEPRRGRGRARQQGAACARRWAPAGTSPTPLCSWPPTRPASSPA